MAAVRDFVPSPGAPETGATMVVTGPFAARGAGAGAAASGALALGAGPDATGGGEPPPGMLAAICGAILTARARSAALFTPLQGSAPARPAMSCSPETRPTRWPLLSVMSRM